MLELYSSTWHPDYGYATSIRLPFYSYIIVSLYFECR